MREEKEERRADVREYMREFTDGKDRLVKGSKEDED